MKIILLSATIIFSAFFLYKYTMKSLAVQSQMGKGISSFNQCHKDYIRKLKTCEPYECTIQTEKKTTEKRQIFGYDSGVCKTEIIKNNRTVSCQLSKKSISYMTQTLENSESLNLQHIIKTECSMN